jgi:hypothetical protein
MKFQKLNKSQPPFERGCLRRGDRPRSPALPHRRGELCSPALRIAKPKPHSPLFKGGVRDADGGLSKGGGGFSCAFYLHYSFFASEVTAKMQTTGICFLTIISNPI